MHIEVDQSGKIGDTSVPTILAFSNGESFAILISAPVKRECLQWLRRHKKLGKIVYLRLFAAALFLLLQDHLSYVTYITIDVEYPGHDHLIRGMLLEYIWRVLPAFGKEGIVFRRVGKKSGAHRRAYAVYRRESLPDRKIRTRALLALLR